MEDEPRVAGKCEGTADIMNSALMNPDQEVVIH